MDSASWLRSDGDRQRWLLHSRMAAEWVKWANHTNDYNVPYWEVGNELNGDWELAWLPDGSTMTGEHYAQHFLKFAKAMRAEDPTIKLGGPACSDLALDFVEALIRDGGNELDFISIHAYPVGVNVKNSREKFAAIESMREAARKVHRWIETYQPQRQDKIEIGISEWNIKVNEDRDTAELINGIWSALWIGALFEEGIDFANQWDLSTYVREGGHSAFYIDEKNDRILPKSQYWALWIWGNLMGNQLVKSKIRGHKDIHSFVTRSEDGLQIMLINTSETHPLKLSLETWVHTAQHNDTPFPAHNTSGIHTPISPSGVARPVSSPFNSIKAAPSPCQNSASQSCT